MLRSVVAVAFGLLTFLFSIVLGDWLLLVMTMGVDALKSSPLAPSPGYFRANLGWSFIAAVAAGYVTAALAPGARFRHAAVLACGWLVLSMISARLVSTALLPSSYAVLAAAVTFGGMLLGGAFRARRPA